MKIRVYERDDGNFLLKIDKYHVGYSTSRDLMYKTENGRYINIKDNGVIVPAWENNIFRIKISNPIVGYKYKKNGTIISVEKHADKRTKLYTNATDDDGCFYTIEQRNKWNDFKNSIDAVKEEKTDEIPVSKEEIAFCGYISKTERFISPTPSLAKEHAGYFRFNYSAAMLSFFNNFCTQYGFVGELDNNRSHLKYAKVDGQFFTNRYYPNYKLRPENFKGFTVNHADFTGSLSECINEKKSLKEYMRSAFERENIKRNGILDLDDMMSKLSLVKLGKLNIDELIEMVGYSSNKK